MQERDRRMYNEKKQSPPADRCVECFVFELLNFFVVVFEASSKVFCFCSGQAVAIIIFVLGLGTLLPWNFFMTASQVLFHIYS